ncbi:MAG: hypothetical protein ABJA02_07840 [Acidobacteriota bacterium]
MNYIYKAAGFGVLIIAVLSCSLAGKLVEKGLDKGLNTKRAGSLWSDVPQMDGLNDSPTEDLPMTIKLVLHTFVDMVLNSDKNSQSVSTDWIIYNYKGSETDIKNFYTPAKMLSSGGWHLPEGMETSCFDGKEKGLYGDVCLYQKVEDGKQKGLIIVALPTKEEKTPVFVYFLRAETVAEPVTK